MDGKLRTAIWLTGVFALLACTGDPIPLSVQAGSTIVLPFSDGGPGLNPLAQVGYGGTDYSDPQRGSLVVQLDSVGGFELTTRIAFLAAAPVESRTGPSGLLGVLDFGRNLLVVVDVPDNAPLGTHSLHVVNRRTVGGVVTDTPVEESPGNLAILPNAVQAGSETIYGEPTPTQGWFVNAFFPIAVEDIPKAIPPPSFGVAVTTPSGTAPQGDTRFVSYVTAEVSYPSQVIDIVRVVAAEPTESLVWHRDDLKGTLRIFALVRSDKGSATGLGPIRVVFDLDDPSATALDLANVGITLGEATDETGNDLIAPWGLVASLTAIR